MKIDICKAYQMVMDAVLLLKNSGIKTEITDSRGRANPPQQYVGDGFLSVDKWVHVSFTFNNEAERRSVADSKRMLGKWGITFDSGGAGNQRDWEIDWSLRIQEDPDKQPLQETVEEVLLELGDQKESPDAIIPVFPTPAKVFFDGLQLCMKNDHDLARSWHDNIAMCAQDEGMPHEAANRAAARFMKLCFGVDTGKKS